MNSLSSDKFFYLSKLIAFADNKVIVTIKLKFDLERSENMVGKGENAGYRIKELTLFQMTNFKLFQLKQFTDNNSKFDENVRKLYKRVENALGKGEIVYHE